MTWRQAFLAQAHSDDAVRRRLNRDPEVAECHQLHYLQVATEKLAKAYSCPPSGGPPSQTHKGFVRLLQMLKDRPDLRRRLGYGTDTASFRRLIDSLLPLADEIERLAPSLAGLSQPNPEYPWFDSGAEELVAPADFAFTAFDAANPKMVKLQGLIKALLSVNEP